MEKFTFTEIIVATLSFIIALCLIYIIRLKVELKTERDKRLTPLLTLEFDQFSQKLYLKNDGECGAKDITFDDLKITLDYNYKKMLRLHFSPIGLLRPKDKETIEFEVFDGPYRVSHEELGNIIGRLAQSSFEISLKFANLENIEFTSTILKEDGKVMVKSLLPSKKKKPSK